MVARGTDGSSNTLFPVVPQSSFPEGATLDDLLVDEAPGSAHALGFTNPIYLDGDGGGYDAAGKSLILDPLPAGTPPRAAAQAERLIEIADMPRADQKAAFTKLLRADE